MARSGRRASVPARLAPLFDPRLWAETDFCPESPEASLIRFPKPRCTFWLRRPPGPKQQGMWAARLASPCKVMFLKCLRAITLARKWPPNPEYRSCESVLAPPGVAANHDYCPVAPNSQGQAPAGSGPAVGLRDWMPTGAAGSCRSQRYGIEDAKVIYLKHGSGPGTPVGRASVSDPTHGIRS